MIHTIYQNKGKYDILFFLPKILISFLASYIISILLKFIFLSERNILTIKEQTTYAKAEFTAQNIKRRIFIKYILFYSLGMLFLVFFWILFSSFGAVYQNTQIFIIKNTLLSYSFALVFPFFYNVIPCIVRMVSLNSKSKGMYNCNKFLQEL